MKKMYLILTLSTFFILLLSCSTQNVPSVENVNNQVPLRKVKPRKQTPMDSAQHIKFNQNNQKQSLLTPSKSKRKKGL